MRWLLTASDSRAQSASGSAVSRPGSQRSSK
jgi:hypothetical protein